MTDIFVPTMMNADSIENPHWSWFRIWVRPKDGVRPELVRERLANAMQRLRRERVKEWGEGAPKQERDWYVNANVSLESAAAGFSGMQFTYRRAIPILAALVALVLLIACANLANLLTAQATSREREMALRVSIGAGRARLVRLVLAESAILAALASALGCVFAWWAAPFVVSLINPPDSPARFVLPADWRVMSFVAALTVLVTLLFGLAPAVRASAVRPVSALKGGNDPRSRRRLMHAMIAAQVAFCFVVHFVAGLFVSSFDRLSNQPVGIVAERLLAVEVSAKDQMPISAWDEVLARVRSLPEVESAGLFSWVLLSGNAWVSPVWANGKGPESGESPYFLGVRPEWFTTMRIRLLDGRDFRPEEVYPRAVFVNETFARRFFDGQNPTGRTTELGRGRNEKASAIVVGYVADTRYNSMRQSPPPIVFTPMNSLDERDHGRTLDWGTIMVRTRSNDPLKIASLLREQIAAARPEFRVSGLRTQQEYIRASIIRERMLAMLSLFFAAVALLLAAIGLYGVLEYSVVQLRREIGIRLALGAQAHQIVRRVATEVFGMLALGSVIGLALGIASERYLETLLYEVKATDFTMLAVPVFTILAAALFAPLPPVIRALRIDPAAMLRAE